MSRPRPLRFVQLFVLFSWVFAAGLHAGAALAQAGEDADEAANQGAAGAGAGALLLKVAPPEVGEKADYGLLLREISRQAVLLAARDELGLSTRDDALGEPVPASEQPVDCTTLVIPSRSYRVRLTRGEQPVWQKEVLIQPRTERRVDIDQIVTQFEALSRGEIPDALKNAGFAAGAARIGGGAPAAGVPPEVETLLGQMHFLAQFEAVRRVHALIRSGGESPALLGALARGYANLGQLLRFLWAPAHKVFAARSLLYAERRVALHPKDLDGLYHRAYARAMAGLHAPALADLDAAKAAAKEAGLGADPQRPAWVDLVDALCRYQTGQLANAGAAGGDLAPLAMYMAFLTVETSGSQGAEVGIAEAALRANPECLRLVDAMADRTGPGPLNRLTEMGPQMFGRSLGGRLEAMSLPDAVKVELARQRPAAGGGARAAGGRLRPAGPISPARPAVIQSLVAAAGKDDGEPSSAALGRLIQEVTFVHVRRRADLITFKWGQDSSAYVAEARPLVAGHRYAKLLDAYGLFRNAPPDVWGKPLSEIRPKDPELSTLAMFDLMRAAMPVPEHAGSPFQLAINSTDDTAWDMERVCTILSRGKGHPDLSNHLARLREVSPHSPVAVSITIKTDWAAAERQIPEWERRFGDHPALTTKLAWKYLMLGRYEEAERWAKRYVEVVPDVAGYYMLAESYRMRGDDANWVATLEKYLASQPDFGLQHATVRVRIAERLLLKGKAEEAVRYAEEAAGSAAAWAMNCAALANERAGRWERAEEWVKRSAGQYNDPGRHFSWCLRTGKGDLADARADTAAHAASVRQDSPREALASAAAFALLDGRPRDALEPLTVLSRRGDPWGGLHAAVLAPDAATRAAALDAILAKAAGRPAHQVERPRLVELAKWFKDKWAAGADPNLDLSAVDATAAKCNADPAEAANIYYFVAEFLRSHGREKDATEYLKRAAAMVLVRSAGTNHTLAWRKLREKGIDPATLPPVPPPGHDELAPEIPRD